MKSSDYWRQREEEQRRHNITDEQAYKEELDRIYQHMIDEAGKEIDAFFARYAKKEGITLAEAKRRADRLDIEEYGRKAKRYVAQAAKERRNPGSTDRSFFSDEANEEMRLYNLTMKVNRLELLKARLGLEMVNGFDEMHQLMDEKLTERALATFTRQAGILGKTVREPEKLAKSIVNASFHNARFSDRIWANQDMLKDELSKALQQGLIQGRGAMALGDVIRKRFDVSQNEANRLMITELARVQTEAQKNSFEENGYEEYEFIALGAAACPDCAALDGRHFKVKDMQIGLNAPPMHPNCRCSTAAWMNRDSYDEWLNSGAAIEEGELETKTDIKYDHKVSESQRNLIKSLSEEYRTRLQEVTRGAQNAAGDVDISGSRMRLSDKHENTALHEFAHTLANSVADKYGLTNDQDFWKEIKKIRREYLKAVGDDSSRWISSYEHSSRSIDEFMAEAFAHAKMRQLGLTLPDKYGNDYTYSQKVLDTIDKYFNKSSNTTPNISDIINNIKKPVGTSGILFFYDGKDRAEKYADQWQSASLKEYIEKYAPGSSGVVNPEKGKIIYKNEGGRYSVVYDYRGDYFRIEDSQLYGRRKYTDLQGRNMANITENGKTRGRSKSEYQRDTHFLNSDSEVEA